MLALGLVTSIVTPGRAAAGQPAVPPKLNNITLRYGDRTTPSDSSTVLLQNIPGLIAVDSGPIVSWRTGAVTASGGGAVGDWGGFLATNTPSATARTPNPTKGSITALTTITLVGSYTYTVTGVAANGAEATATVTIEVVPNAFNVGDVYGGDIMSSRFATKAGGLTWLFSSGWSRTGVYNLQNINPTGRMGMKEADPSKPLKMSGLRVMGCQRVDIDGLTMGGAPNHRFLVDGNSTDCTIKRCKSGADASWNYISPSAPNTHAIYKIDNCTYITIEDGDFTWCPRPIYLGGALFGGLARSRNITIRNNTFRTYYGDAMSIGGCDTILLEGNVFIAPMRNEGNTDHIDGVQFTGASVPGTEVSANVTIKGNFWIQGEGNSGSIAVMNTSVSLTGLVYRCNVLVGRAGTSMNWGNGVADGVIEDTTIFLTMSGKIAQWYHASDPQNDNVTNGVQNLTLYAATNSALRRVLATGSVGGSPSGWTKTDNLGLGIAYTAITQFANVAGQSNYEPTFEPTGVRTYDFTSVFKYPNAFERLNNYNADNLAGADYPNMTSAQIKALVLDVLTPAAGVTAGAIGADGSLKA